MEWKCQMCGNCCKSAPGKYLPSDFTDLDKDLDKMLASKIIVFDLWDEPKIFGLNESIFFPRPPVTTFLPTIAVKPSWPVHFSLGGRCIHLTKDNLCSIYSNRPSECQALNNCNNSRSYAQKYNSDEFSVEEDFWGRLDAFRKSVDTEHAYQLNYIYSWIKYQDIIKGLIDKYTCSESKDVEGCKDG